MTTGPATGPGNASLRDDLRIAKVHLRLGQLTLARAELEDLLARDALDGPGLAALAEARWRTGEGELAADAALAHIEGGGSDDVALCIAAEALAADGRSTEARELMDRLPDADASRLDTLFAGMPRRAFWPAGPVDRSNLEELRREADARTASARRGMAGGRDSATAQAPGRSAVPGPREVIEATGERSWEEAVRRSTEDTQVFTARPAAESHPRPRRVKGQLDPAAELARAREELGTKPERALMRLSLVLRHDPTLAPTVLDMLRLRREPMAALVRGDAQRLLGRQLEAEAAFDAAAESLEAS